VCFKKNELVNEEKEEEKTRKELRRDQS